MPTCPKCHRPLNEGNSPNLEECHAGDDDEDRQCELSAKIWRLKEALIDIRDNYDCDSDAHKYGTSCRCCTAKEALAKIVSK